MSTLHANAMMPPNAVAVDRRDKPRAALVVYRYLLGEPHFLLIGSRRDPSRLTLPGGKVARSERPMDTAIRETLEESGVLTLLPSALGQYLHRKQSGTVHPTRTYLARFAGYRADHEPRKLYWLTPSEIASAEQAVQPAIREHLARAAERLPTLIAAG
ncbi:MAG: NUDIX domain-containing protein [Phycisphaeraceae bacterium]